MELRAAMKVHFANELRQRMTGPEKLLWSRIRKYGFLAQRIVLGYIPDFWHPPTKLMIEVDGSIHSGKQQRSSDHEKDEILRSRGYTVLRFSNWKVCNQTDDVVRTILSRMNK